MSELLLADDTSQSAEDGKMEVPAVHGASLNKHVK